VPTAQALTVPVPVPSVPVTAAPTVDREHPVVVGGRE
jgi:hypothetical protein